MIKSNTKKARQNLKNFLLENFKPYDYGYEVTEEFVSIDELKEFIKKLFYDEMLKHNCRYNAGYANKYQLFIDWSQGLGCCGLFDFWLYRENYNAIDIVAEILEETESEKTKYNNEVAALYLTRLIYNYIYYYNY